MIIPQSLKNLVSSDPDVVGGEPCFTGTRVPLETVVDNLAAGHSTERIIENFPSLRAEGASIASPKNGDTNFVLLNLGKL